MNDLELVDAAGRVQCLQSLARMPERFAVTMGPRTVGCDLVGESATDLVQTYENSVVNELDHLLGSSCGFVVELLPAFGHGRHHVLTDGGIMRIAEDFGREHDLDERVSVGDTCGVDEDVARLQGQGVENRANLSYGLDE